MVGRINIGFYWSHSYQHSLSVLVVFEMAFVNNFTEESCPGTWLKIMPVTAISRGCSMYMSPLLQHKEAIRFTPHRASPLCCNILTSPDPH